MQPITINILVLFSGIILGYFGRLIYFRIKENSLENKIREKLSEARKKSIDIVERAQVQSESLNKILNEKESFLIEKELNLNSQIKNFEDKKREYDLMLEEISGMTKDEILEFLFKKIETEYQESLFKRFEKNKKISEDYIKEEAKKILANALNKIAVDTTSETTTSFIEIENENQKSKIIGKDGVNIKTLENILGVNILVDEKPNQILLSSFDGVRRAIAKMTIENLLKDGRVNPVRIEEISEESKNKIHEEIRRHGASAVAECKIKNIDPHLVTLLGKLHFRNSYGQNVLAHSIEVSHIANSIAFEIGADNEIAKTAGLLHDIGKALDHEFEGNHVELGIKILRRFNTDEKIIDAMKSHHDHYPHESVESVIVQTADAISASRKGARNNKRDEYTKRLSDIESLIQNFEGVEKVFALSSGRDIRVFVHPEKISDLEASILSKEIAMAIEDTILPIGNTKITIIRELRIINHVQ